MLRCADILTPLVAAGDLYAARKQAVAHCFRPLSSSNGWTPSTVSAFDKDCGSECAAAWKEQVDVLLLRNDALDRIAVCAG